jgi:Fe-Mn family superoxide dismutase
MAKNNDAKDHELIGNFEVLNGEVMTRREVLLMGAIAASGFVAATPSFASANPTVTGAQVANPLGPYLARDFSTLTNKKLDGFSASQIAQHLKLYQGYVGKANEITAKLKDADLQGANATYAPLRELLVEESYAVNGVIFHEFYFGNLGSSGGEPSGESRSALEERWGSIPKFMDYLKAAGKCMRGWVIVGYNTRGGHLSAFGLDLHNMWVPANFIPILVLDVYEHAYMIDYGIDRGKYLDAFVNNLDWDVVEKRLSFARKHPILHESTT